MVTVYVPAGEFLMGSTDRDPDAGNDEKPQHKVILDAFWIDRTEVTNAMFAKFAAALGYKTDAEKVGKGSIFDPVSRTWKDAAGANWQHPRGSVSDLTGRIFSIFRGRTAVAGLMTEPRRARSETGPSCPQIIEKILQDWTSIQWCR